MTDHHVPLNVRLSASLNGVVSRLRPCCHALLTHDGAVLDAGERRPLAKLRGNAPATPEVAFADAVADLLKLMDEVGVRGRRVRVWVSDYWSRPLVIPMTGPTPSDEDIDSLLQSLFRRTYSDLMAGWRWCWDRHAQQLLAVAWPEKGLTELRAGITQRGGFLASAMPLAVDLGSRAFAPEAASWVAIIESKSVSLIRQQGGAWLHWCVLPQDSHHANDSAGLPLQLTREVARRKDECRALTLVNLEGGHDLRALQKSLTDEGWTVRVRQPHETRSGVPFRLLQATTSALMA